MQNVYGELKFLTDLVCSLLLSIWIWNLHLQDVPLTTLKYRKKNFSLFKTNFLWLTNCFVINKVRNGRDRRAPLVGRYCNSFSLVPIVSKATSLYVKFKSDINLAGRGFKARYETRMFKQFC